jgi:putative addiction module component (TIGR02574 family)
MSTATLEKMAGSVLKLPKQARAYLAERLLESLDDENDFLVSREWLAEARRRGRELDSGRGEAIPGPIALKRLRGSAA